jgi:hypothetical protein
VRAWRLAISNTHASPVKNSLSRLSVLSVTALRIGGMTGLRGIKRCPMAAFMPRSSKEHAADQWAGRSGRRQHACKVIERICQAVPAKRATVADVAALAGVARATASYALLGDAKIPVHTRKRV